MSEQPKKFTPQPRFVGQSNNERDMFPRRKSKGLAWILGTLATVFGITVVKQCSDNQAAQTSNAPMTSYQPTNPVVPPVTIPPELLPHHDKAATQPAALKPAPATVPTVPAPPSDSHVKKIQPKQQKQELNKDSGPTSMGFNK